MTIHVDLKNAIVRDTLHCPNRPIDQQIRDLWGALNALAKTDDMSDHDLELFVEVTQHPAIQLRLAAQKGDPR